MSTDLIQETAPLTIAAAVDHMLDTLPTAGHELREENRHPFPRTIQVTKDNKTDLCAGKDISRGGIGFLHIKPLYGVIIVSMTTPVGHHFRFLAEVVRARQVGRFYEVGAKFIERIV